MTGQSNDNIRPETSALLRLMSWMSPSFPIGAFAYSHGLEAAVEAGLVTDSGETQNWLEDVLRHGAGQSDAIFLKCAYVAIREQNKVALSEICELSAAFSPSLELRQETLNQGQAFRIAVCDVWPSAASDWFEEVWPHPCAYPVAVAVAAAGHGVALDAGIPAYLHGFAANMISAAVRLVPLGQTQGQIIMQALETVIIEMSDAALGARVQDISTSTLSVDMCAMQHETQYTRLFRS